MMSRRRKKESRIHCRQPVYAFKSTVCVYAGTIWFGVWIFFATNAVLDVPLHYNQFITVWNTPNIQPVAFTDSMFATELCVCVCVRLCRKRSLALVCYDSVNWWSSVIAFIRMFEFCLQKTYHSHWVELLLLFCRAMQCSFLNRNQNICNVPRV